MTAPRQPRQWNEGAYMPEDRPDVVDKRGVQWAWDCEEEAYAAYGRDEVCSWAKLFRLFGPLVEVLPETPQPPHEDWQPKRGERVIAKLFSRPDKDVEGEFVDHASNFVSRLNVGLPMWTPVLRATLRPAAPQSSPAPLLPLSAPVETEGQVEGVSEALSPQSETELKLWNLLDKAEQEYLASDEPCDRKSALVRAVLAEGWRPSRTPSSQVHVELAKTIAESAGIPQSLAATVASVLIEDEGWRPPLPASGPPKPLSTEPGAVTRLSVNIGPRTAEALNAVVAEHGTTLTEALRSLVAAGYAAAQRPPQPERGVWLSPDWTGLAIEAEDGSLYEVGREHGDGAWVSQGMLDMVPDHWLRLVALPADEPTLLRRLSALFASTGRQHPAAWLADAATAVEEGREWPVLPDKPRYNLVDVYGYDGRFLYAGLLQARTDGGWNVFHHTDSRHIPAVPVEPKETP